jgi:hypothetical protein
MVREVPGRTQWDVARLPSAAMDAVLSHYQASPLLTARVAGLDVATTSLDLGLTTVDVRLEAGGVRTVGGRLVGWTDVEAIAAAPNACYRVVEGGVEPIRAYSDELDRLYSLMPTARAPTLLVSGTYMHRIKGTDPVADTEAKLATVAPILGRVLDTTTGLGYTAIGTARTARAVTPSWRSRVRTHGRPGSSTIRRSSSSSATRPGSSPGCRPAPSTSSCTTRRHSRSPASSIPGRSTASSRACSDRVAGSSTTSASSTAGLGPGWATAWSGACAKRASNG